MLLLSLSLSLVSLSLVKEVSAQTYSGAPGITTPIVSTRGQFNLTTGELNWNIHSSTDYYASNVPGFPTNIAGLDPIIKPCNNKTLPAVAIYVHGVWANQMEAKEQLDRITMSLKANNITIPVIGFSWDSNTKIFPYGWGIAKAIADQNGPKLAKFITDFSNTCKGTSIRIIAHSMGARVVASALVSLNNTHFEPGVIKSVNFLGAAINNKSTASNTSFGTVIQHLVGEFYNLYSPQDILLRISYAYTEHQQALGLLGLQKGLPKPTNYIDQNVEFEIPPFHDANGTAQPDCGDNLVAVWGDNHCGYIGFRYHYPGDSLLKDDGAMNIVARDWNQNK